MPVWLKNAPSLDPSLSHFYAAFCELTTCRMFGMSPGPIPWTAVMAYADDQQLYGMDRDDLLYLVRAMDTAYLNHAEDQSKIKNKPAKKGGKIGGG